MLFRQKYCTTHKPMIYLNLAAAFAIKIGGFHSCCQQQLMVL
jgi:hypothetical protein